MNRPLEASCSGCEVAEALSRDRGTWEWCKVCGAQVRATAPSPASAPVLCAAPQFTPVQLPADGHARRSTPRHPLLQLLRDCAAIARWDAYAAPRSLLAILRGSDPDDAPRPALLDDEDGQVRREQARQRALDNARALRARLEGLRRVAAEDARALDLLRVLALAVAWDAAAQRGTTPPAWPLPPLCDTAIAVGVLDWLVPRAVALSESAHGDKGKELEKHFHKDLAEAFVDAAQRAAWDPPKPVPPARPVLPEPPPPWDPDAWWPERKRYPEIVAAWLAALEDYPDAVQRFERAKAGHKDALREWPKRCAQGAVGRDRHARELLAIAIRVWFATGAAPGA